MSPIKEYVPLRCNYMYICYVAADGTFVFGPHGWNVQRTATGVYVITHNIGSDLYLAISENASTDYRDAALVTNRANDSLTVSTFDNGQPTDWDFRLIVFNLSQ